MLLRRLMHCGRRARLRSWHSGSSRTPIPGQHWQLQNPAKAGSNSRRHSQAELQRRNRPTGGNCGRRRQTQGSRASPIWGRGHKSCTTLPPGQLRSALTCCAGCRCLKRRRLLFCSCTSNFSSAVIQLTPSQSRCSPCINRCQQAPAGCVDVEDEHRRYCCCG